MVDEGNVVFSALSSVAVIIFRSKSKDRGRIVSFRGAGPSDLRAHNRNAKAVYVASLAPREVRFNSPRLDNLKQ